LHAALRICPALPAGKPLPVHRLSEDRRGDHGGRGDGPMSKHSFRAVGRPIPRIDGLEKVTGRARYVTDLVIPGMAHAKVLRSPYAHARVRKVCVTRARWFAPRWGVRLPRVVSRATGRRIAIAPCWRSTSPATKASRSRR